MVPQSEQERFESPQGLSRRNLLLTGAGLLSIFAWRRVNIRTVLNHAHAIPADKERMHFPYPSPLQEMRNLFPAVCDPETLQSLVALLSEVEGKAFKQYMSQLSILRNELSVGKDILPDDPQSALVTAREGKERSLGVRFTPYLMALVTEYLGQSGVRAFPDTHGTPFVQPKNKGEWPMSVNAVALLIAQALYDWDLEARLVLAPGNCMQGFSPQICISFDDSTTALHAVSEGSPKADFFNQDALEARFGRGFSSSLRECPMKPPAFGNWLRSALVLPSPKPEPEELALKNP